MEIQKSDPDIQVDVKKEFDHCELRVSLTGTGELSQEQALSGVIAGYVEMCRQTQTNYLEYFMDEMGIKHHIQYEDHKDSH